MSHLEVYHSKTKPITYDVDHLLNNKWIHIQQTQAIDQLEEIYQNEIKNHFLHKVTL